MTLRRSALVLVLLLAAPVAQAQPGLPPLAAKILRSRKQVAKAAGEAVAESIPEGFDFGLHALVWLDLPADPEARATIVTIPADRPLDHTRSPAESLRLVRARRSVRVEISVDRPCSGGMQKPQEIMAACREQVAMGVRDARKVVTLFATPRAHLKRVKVRSRVMPGRP